MVVWLLNVVIPELPVLHMSLPSVFIYGLKFRGLAFKGWSVNPKGLFGPIKTVNVFHCPVKTEVQYLDLHFILINQVSVFYFPNL